MDPNGASSILTATEGRSQRQSNVRSLKEALFEEKLQEDPLVRVYAERHGDHFQTLRRPSLEGARVHHGASQGGGHPAPEHPVQGDDRDEVRDRVFQWLEEHIAAPARRDAAERGVLQQQMPQQQILQQQIPPQQPVPQVRPNEMVHVTVVLHVAWYGPILDESELFVLAMQSGEVSVLASNVARLSLAKCSCGCWTT